MLLTSRTPLDAALLADFASKDEDVPYAEDPTILNREDLLADMDAVEDRYAKSITGAMFAAVDRVLPQTLNILAENNTKEDKLNALDKITWNGSSAVQSALTGLWHEGWGLGTNHATQELNVNLAKNGRNSKYACQSSPIEIAEFRSGVFIAYPPDYGIPLQNTALKEAVNQRTLKLANDVAADTARSIQAAVLDAVDKHPGREAIPQRERSRLVQRINLALGRQSAKELRDPNKGVGDPLVATQRVGTVFTSRARTIARTELSASYSLGRVQTYLQAGVKRVRWQAIGDLRTCAICRTRSGTVHDLQTVLSQTRIAYRAAYDPAEYVIPAHPNDRCHWEPIFEEDSDIDASMSADPGRNPATRAITPLRKGWAALGVASSVITEVERRQRETRQERTRQGQIKKLFFKAALTGGAAALSLSLLYALLAKAEEQRQSREREKVTEGRAEQPNEETLVERTTGVEADEIVTKAIEATNKERAARQAAKETPVTPNDAMDADLARRFPELLKADLDLSITPRSVLERYGLRREEIARLTKRVQLVKNNLGQPLTRSISPNLLPPELLARYPDLRDIPDVRQLTTEDLVRVGVDRDKAPQVESFIRRQLQNKIGLPSVQVGRGTSVGETDLANADAEAIEATLPANLNNRARVARNIAQYIKQRAVTGDPVTDVGDLANVPGVGRKTIRNWRSQQYVANPNSALLSVTRDDVVAESFASQLGIGSKKASEIVREFRERGEFRDEEDLIQRLDERLAGSRLHLSEREKQSIRRSLKGRVFPTGASSTTKQALRQVRRQSAAGESDPELTRITGRPSPSAVPGAPPSPQLAPGDDISAPPGLPPASSPLTTPPGQMPGYQTPQTIRDDRAQRVRDRVRRNQGRQPAVSTPGTITTPNQELIRRRNQEAYEDRVDRLKEDARQYRQDLSSRVDSSVYRARLFRKDQTIKDARNEAAKNAGTAVRDANNLGLRLNDYAARAGESADKISERIDAIDEAIDTDLDAAEREINQLRNESRKLLQETVPQPDTERLLKTRDELDNVRVKAVGASDEVFPELEAKRNAIVNRADELRRENPDTGEGFENRLNELKDDARDISQNVIDARQNQVIADIDRQLEQLDYTIARLQGVGQAQALQQYQEARARLTNAKNRLEKSRDKANLRRKALLGIDSLDRRVNEIASTLTKGEQRQQQIRDDITTVVEDIQQDNIPGTATLGVIQGKLSKLSNNLDSYANQLDEAANAARGFLQGANAADVVKLRDILGRIGRARAEVARQKGTIPDLQTRNNRIKQVVSTYDLFRAKLKGARKAAARFEEGASRFIEMTREKLQAVRAIERPTGAPVLDNPQGLQQLLQNLDTLQKNETFFNGLEDFTNREQTQASTNEVVDYLEQNWKRLTQNVEVLRPFDITGLGQRAFSTLKEARDNYNAFVEARDALSSRTPGDSELGRPSARVNVTEGIQRSQEILTRAYSLFMERLKVYSSEGAPLATRNLAAYRRAISKMGGEDALRNASAYTELKGQVQKKENEIVRTQQQANNANKKAKPALQQQIEELEREAAELDRQGRQAALELWDSRLPESDPRRELLPVYKESVAQKEADVAKAEEDLQYFPKDRQYQREVRDRLNKARQELRQARRELRDARGLSESEEDALFSHHRPLAQFMSDNKYTNPGLRESLKDKILKGSKGGRAGQWSARKAQMLASQYKARGGSYKQGKSKSQKSLSQWTKQKWQTSDGKPAIRGSKTARYLPKKAWDKLSKSEKDATNRKKREGKGQFIPNTGKAKKARKSASFSSAFVRKPRILRAIRRVKNSFE